MKPRHPIAIASLFALCVCPLTTVPAHEAHADGASPSLVPAGQPPPAAQQSRRRRHRRPGCGTYCQQAGPPAGTGGGRRPPVRVSHRTVRLIDGGVARLRVHCVARTPCRGALYLRADTAALDVPDPLAAVDLVVAAERTSTVEVTLSRAGRGFVQRVRRVRVLALVTMPGFGFGSDALALLAGRA